MKAAIIGSAIAFALALSIVSFRQNGEVERLYRDRCAACHANDGSGNTPRGKAMKVPDLRSTEVQNKTDAQLFEAIVKAKVHSAASRELREEDARRLASHMRTFK